MNQFDEPDDDAARVASAERQLYGITIEKLLAVRGHSRGVQAFLKNLAFTVNVLRQMPGESDIKRIKEMAWQYRRQMPQHLARKTNPDDPVVREMEARHG